MSNKDFRNIDEKTFLDKEGVFKATITDVKTETSQKGNEMWVVSLNTEHGDCTKYFVFTEKSMPFLKRDFRLIGCNVDDELITSESLIGKTAFIKAKREIEIQKDAFGNIIGEAPGKYLTIDFCEEE